MEYNHTDTSKRRICENCDWYRQIDPKNVYPSLNGKGACHGRPMRYGGSRTTYDDTCFMWRPKERRS